jgi:hypothetical protein
MSGPDAHASAPASVEGAALRDARSIATRIAADEAAADTARQSYQAGGLPAIATDDAAKALLRPSEFLHSVHANALLEETLLGNGAGQLRGGTLYVTSERLIHAGTETMEVSLGAIDEMAVALERLVLIRLRDGSDLAIEVDQPRVLRVQLSAAIAGTRAA